MISMQDGKFFLELHRVYNASKESVFLAWTREEQLKQWWGLTGFTTTIGHMDVSIGGKYLFHMRAPNGKIHTVEGRYVEIVPNDKLSFTWKWVTEGDDSEETLVTIDFVDQDNSTELVITHTNFSTMKEAKKHNNSWTNSLEGGLCDYLN
ncbi:SRPBCC family protein [Cohnella nanjingensis]|uniref:SRPBCC domain-containing protein n=1 Tax=Cohnella nanjingensis TaxID=1387779 RepID=A0A7X0RWK6_9BACL|nr:SRPBCC domain-containing protein [Cohnella nanjingensis]MBB6673786.1 SRPBCC domain-containing protein [Cohnella nanjingensis]